MHDTHQTSSPPHRLKIRFDYAANASRRRAEQWSRFMLTTPRVVAALRTGPEYGTVERRQAGQFDCVVAEALDRLSRDQEDIAAIYKRLRHADIRLFTLAEGEISELHVGLKGTMNALFLSDLAQKTRRGQRGRVEAGKIPGGNSYGYRIVRRLLDDGSLAAGEREIDPEQAAIVRRIFEEYARGVSPRQIAARLNSERVCSSPRGGQWNASTINGNRQRRNGILNNELYVGRITYNRQRFVKDPDTAKRVARLNPRAPVGDTGSSSSSHR